MITILTDPVPIGRYRFTEYLKKLGRPVKRFFHPPQIWRLGLNLPYRGHYGVTRSLVEGFKKTLIPHIYNPQQLINIDDVVVVLSGLDALRQAIGWKRKGRIHRLLAGPNLMLLPSQYPELWGSEVDVCLVPSKWISAVYEQDLPTLQGRCAIWPAGVDTEYWKPSEATIQTKTALFYVKENDGPFSNIHSFSEMIEQHGYSVEWIHVGRYTPEQYREALCNCEFLVGFSHVESQGLAWAEAWAMDKPTLLWSNTKFSIQGKACESSTAPWLTNATGRFFSNLTDFANLLDQIANLKLSMEPRKWVLDNMSDNVCAGQLLKLAFPISVKEESYTIVSK